MPSPKPPTGAEAPQTLDQLAERLARRLAQGPDPHRPLTAGGRQVPWQSHMLEAWSFIQKALALGQA